MPTLKLSFVSFAATLRAMRHAISPNAVVFAIKDGVQTDAVEFVFPDREFVVEQGDSMYAKLPVWGIKGTFRCVMKPRGLLYFVALVKFTARTMCSGADTRARRHKNAEMCVSQGREGEGKLARFAVESLVAPACSSSAVCAHPPPRARPRPICPSRSEDRKRKEKERTTTPRTNTHIPFPSPTPPLVPPAPLHTPSNATAKSAGFKLRPLSETARDTWAWLNNLEEGEKKLMKEGIGMTREEEKELLKLWGERSRS